MTFEEIGIEIGGILDQPGLAFFEIGTEFTILGRKTADWAVQNAYRLGFIRHWSTSSTASQRPFGADRVFRSLSLCCLNEIREAMNSEGVALECYFLKYIIF